MYVDPASVLLTALLVSPAASLALGAMAVGRRAEATEQWSTARHATIGTVLAAAAALTALIMAGAESTALVRLDEVTAVMVGLVALIGWVVVRFSAHYLAGDRGEQRYAQRILATLAAVSTVVVANNLVLLVLAWTAASVALHGLLTHFGDRRVAVAVAHKKFLLARSADACMVGAVVAFAMAFDTLRIDGITAAAASEATLPASARLAVALVAIAALLKCAQLPFHGWLIQVMEAPTPVSALLHAGVVNLGGFVLLRFAPVVDRAVETRALVVTVGLLTALAASLVMTTRVSVKVALAWSTCAQMGFMLVQCGLGLWPMALLHLAAHSVYKAYAFLSAGDTVRQTQRRRLAPIQPPPSWSAAALGTGTALAGAVAVGLGWELVAGAALSPTVWVMLGVVALAATALTTPTGRHRRGAPLVAALGLPLAYLALHDVFERLVAHGPDAPAALLVMVVLGVTALFVLQHATHRSDPAPRIQRLRRWVYAGFFLDDAFTRLAFRLSPPPPPRPRVAPLPRPHAVAVVLTAGASADADLDALVLAEASGRAR